MLTPTHLVHQYGQAPQYQFFIDNVTIQAAPKNTIADFLEEGASVATILEFLL